MHTVIIFAIAGLLWGLIREAKEWGWKDGTTWILGIVQAIMAAVLGLVLAFALPVKYETIKWDLPLTTLQDGKTISGSFMLGSGQINGRMEYVFYTQDKDSTYRMYEVSNNDARIRYTSESPRCEVTLVEPAKTFWNGFAISAKGSRQSYIFDVPRGSIKTDFSLDAK